MWGQFFFSKIRIWNLVKFGAPWSPSPRSKIWIGKLVKSAQSSKIPRYWKDGTLKVFSYWFWVIGLELVLITYCKITENKRKYNYSCIDEWRKSIYLYRNIRYKLYWIMNHILTTIHILERFIFLILI